MIRIVAPTPEQLETVRTWWVRSLVGRQPGERVPLGRCLVAGHLALLAARQLVERLLEECMVAVGELEAVPGEALGFVAWTPAEGVRPLSVHMVYVLGPDQPEGARRLGYGTALLRHAVGDAGHYRSTCETHEGKALLGAFRIAKAWGEPWRIVPGDYMAPGQPVAAERVLDAEHLASMRAEEFTTAPVMGLVREVEGGDG